MVKLTLLHYTLSTKNNVLSKVNLKYIFEQFFFCVPILGTKISNYIDVLCYTYTYFMQIHVL